MYTLEEAKQIIRHKLKQDTLCDVVDGTGVTAPTIRRWRDEGVPERASLTVFVKFAIYYGISVDVTELGDLL